MYKYLAPERVTVLDEAKLRYTPLGAFNDPFEGRPEITQVGTDEEALQSLADALPKEAAKVYETLPPEVKRALPFSVMLNQLQAHANTKQLELLQQFRSLTGIAKSLLHQKFDEHIGALCLSEVPDSLLMWSHYGASHSGFVIEFDAHHEYFNEKRSDKDEFRHLRRVLYRETRPSMPLSQLEGPDLFLVKSGHWSYEREWRILRALSEATTIIQASPFPVHLFPFPRPTILSVILGARVTDTSERAIRAALAIHPEYKGVQLRRAIPDPTHFLLRIVDDAS
ncbi:MAG: DUF2971 domain-containing protein [Thiobacillus sp.]